MPDIVGRLRSPRLSAAPASPVLGEIYFNTVESMLYYYNGWAWVKMGPPIELIEKQSLSVAGQFNFTSIPQTYTSLHVSLNCRGASAVAGGIDAACIRFNSVVSGTYNNQRQWTYSTAISADIRDGYTFGYAGFITDSAYVGMGVCEIQLPGYERSSGYRVWYGEGNALAPGSGGRLFVLSGVNWGLTTAINQLNLFAESATGNNFAAGSRWSSFFKVEQKAREKIIEDQDEHDGVHHRFRH